MPQLCQILQKYTNFGESDTHLLTFLKSSSNIGHGNQNSNPKLATITSATTVPTLHRNVFQHNFPCNYQLGISFVFFQFICGIYRFCKKILLGFCPLNICICPNEALLAPYHCLSVNSLPAQDPIQDIAKMVNSYTLPTAFHYFSSVLVSLDSCYK